MKKTILALAVVVLMAGLFSISFGQAADKKATKARENLQEANKDVVDAKKDLKEAKKDSVTEYDKFRKESEIKIKNNEKSIADFKVKIAKQKKDLKAKNEKKLAVLEEKNNALKAKLDTYNKEESKDKWAKFKKEFTHDMNELGKAFKDLTVKNT